MLRFLDREPLRAMVSERAGKAKTVYADELDMQTKTGIGVSPKVSCREVRTERKSLRPNLTADPGSRHLSQMDRV